MSEVVYTLTDCLSDQGQNWAVLVLWPTEDTFDKNITILKVVCFVINAALACLLVHKTWNSTHTPRKDAIEQHASQDDDTTFVVDDKSVDKSIIIL